MDGKYCREKRRINVLRCLRYKEKAHQTVSFFSFCYTTPMDSAKKPYTTIDAYIMKFPKSVQETLQTLRKTIKEELPEAEEVISYGVPTFKMHGSYVVYIAAFTKHISIYPASDALITKLPEVAPLRKGKGTLQFPIDQQLPYPLIRKIVQFLYNQNQERTKK